MENREWRMENGKFGSKKELNKHKGQVEFTPANPVVQRCLQGMAKEDEGQAEEAKRIFELTWQEANNDFEKYLAAFYLSRHQNSIADQLEWLETCLRLADKINDDAVMAAFPMLHASISICYEKLGEPDRAEHHEQQASSFSDRPADHGPFFHGTKADLKAGDFLTAGTKSNYKAELTMNHVYFTALINGAGLAASLAKGEGRERVYVVEPNGNFEHDPNVTNKKFPGNPTRSYRSEHPLRIVSEVSDWRKQTPEDIRRWKEKLDKNKGEIIN